MSGNMLKEDRVAFIDQRLQELYPNPPVPLDHTDPYTLLVAVLLSAQCTDERVNQVTLRFLSWQIILLIWPGECRNYSRHHQTLRLVTPKIQSD